MVGATILAYLAPIVNPQITWKISFFGLFYPILLGLNFVFIFFWLFKKPIYLIPSLLCVVLGWSQLKGFVGLNSTKPEVIGDTFTLITYNISSATFGSGKRGKSMDEKKKEFTDILEKYSDTDIFCLQEVGDFAYKIIKGKLPKYNIHHTKKGAVILSKYPFTKKGEVDFGTKVNSCLWADVRIKGEDVRVYSYHLQSNQISQDAENLNISYDMDQKKAWYDIKGMLRKYKNTHLQRSSQVEKIADHARNYSGKVILAGDLNDPPQSYTYNVFSKLGKDVFREKGRGIGTTYAGRIPLLRIDYIFSDKSMNVIECHIIKGPFSDHYGVASTLEFTKNRE